MQRQKITSKDRNIQNIAKEFLTQLSDKNLIPGALCQYLSDHKHLISGSMQTVLFPPVDVISRETHEAELEASKVEKSFYQPQE
ncbi:MAG: hypothetical protein QM752_00020 [Gammaproteobacteria bacterium]